MSQPIFFAAECVLKTLPIPKMLKKLLISNYPDVQTLSVTKN